MDAYTLIISTLSKVIHSQKGWIDNTGEYTIQLFMRMAEKQRDEMETNA